MSYKYLRNRIITGFLCFILFAGCETKHRDYYYVVENSADAAGNVLLIYLLNGVTETQFRWLEPNESFLIYERKGVSGDDIWNIETSTLMYAFPTIVATNHDVTQMTEELSQRNYWPPQPNKQDGNGVYLLKITDDLFVLEKQGCDYLVHNMTDDSLFVTSALHGYARRRDTIVCGQTANIGWAEIFTYSENIQDTDKYIEKKLSGIATLSVKYKENSKNIDLKKQNLFNWQIEEQTCTLIVDESVFN